MDPYLQLADDQVDYEPSEEDPKCPILKDNT